MSSRPFGKAIGTLGRVLHKAGRSLRSYAQPFVCRTRGAAAVQELLAAPTLLVPLALVVVTIRTIVAREFYQPDCTLALLTTLSGTSSGHNCAQVPLTGDWPSVVGGALALAMFFLYRRLSVLITGLDSAQPLFANASHHLPVPNPRRYAVHAPLRLAFLAASTAVGLFTYGFAYNRGAWFVILGGQTHEAALRENWWANWHTYPDLAALWVVTASLTIYLGLDNFLTSTLITRDLRALLRDELVLKRLPFVPNLPSHRTAWAQLQDFLGEMQYGALIALGSATLTTVLVVTPNDTTSISLALLGNAIFVTVMAVRFSAMKGVLEDAARAALEQQVNHLEARRTAAQQAGDYLQAGYWLLEGNRALRYGPLPVLPARQVTVRLIAVTTASVSLVATIIQTLH